MPKPKPMYEKRLVFSGDTLHDRKEQKSRMIATIIGSQK